MDLDELIRNNVQIDQPRKGFTRPIRVARTAKFDRTYRPNVRYFQGNLSNFQELAAHFDAKPSRLTFNIYKLNLGPTTTTQSLYEISNPNPAPSALQVFKDITILPYAIQATKSFIDKELLLLQAEYRSLQTTRIPAVYRISASFICDDLGRIYRKNTLGLYEWFQFPIKPSGRNDITLKNLDGTYLKRALYTFNAVAGYSSYTQAHFLFTLQYDFHHVEENKMDIRPTRIVPLEVRLHRFIHSKNLEAQVGGFFKGPLDWW